MTTSFNQKPYIVLRHETIINVSIAGIRRLAPLRNIPQKASFVRRRIKEHVANARHSARAIGLTRWRA